MKVRLVEFDAIFDEISNIMKPASDWLLFQGGDPVIVTAMVGVAGDPALFKNGCRFAA